MIGGNDGISFATNTVKPNEEQNAEAKEDYPQETETTHANTTLGQGGWGHGGSRNGGRGGQGCSHDNIQCFHCGAMGHYASQCPESLEDAQRMLEENTETATNMLHHATINEPMTETTNEMTLASLDHNEMEDNDASFVFVQDIWNVETQHGGHRPPEWILLDNQSTMDVLTN